MSDTKFTPGPWELSLEVPNWGEGEDDPEFYSVYIGGEAVDVPTDNAKADANLIAAAPDLYAALEAMFAIGTTSECHEGPCGHKACGLAKAALAKARGE